MQSMILVMLTLECIIKILKGGFYMMNLKTSIWNYYPLTCNFIQNPVFGEDSEASIFPDWVKQATSIWINGQISDSEFCTNSKCS